MFKTEILKKKKPTYPVFVNPILHAQMNGSIWGGRTPLPKFKFSAKFPIGLHMILQIQIKKNQKCLISFMKNILTENPLGFNFQPLLK